MRIAALRMRDSALTGDTVDLFLIPTVINLPPTSRARINHAFSRKQKDRAITPRVERRRKPPTDRLLAARFNAGGEDTFHFRDSYFGYSLMFRVCARDRRRKIDADGAFDVRSDSNLARPEESNRGILFGQSILHRCFLHETAKVQSGIRRDIRSMERGFFSR